MKRLLVNAKKIVKGKSWRERMKETFDRDPLECTECGNYLEFKGIAVRKNGRLEVAFANEKDAKKYMEREIEKIESKTYKIKKEEATRKAVKKYWFSWEELEKAIKNNSRRIYLPDM